MKKLIQILIVCGLFVVMGGTNSFAEYVIPQDGDELDKICSKGSYPKTKNMIEVKGFYIGMNICDAKKVMTKGKYNKLFPPDQLRYQSNVPRGRYKGSMLLLAAGPIPFDTAPSSIWEVISPFLLQADQNGVIHQILIKSPLINPLFKSKGMTLEQFTQAIVKHYVKGDPRPDRNITYRPPSDLGPKYSYRNGQAGYKFSIRTTLKDPQISEFKITAVPKESEGFGD